MSVQKEFALYVPIKGESVKSVGNVVQNDIGGNKIIIRLTDGKNPIDLTGYTNITFSVLKPDGTYVVDSLGDRIAVVDALQGAISVVLHDNAINMAGSCMATIEVFSGATRVTSARLSFVVTADLTAGADPSSDSSYPVLLSLIADVSAFVDAEALRVTAETGRVNAENTRTTNESSRASGEEGRVLAENSRVSAETSRVNAETLRNTAESDRESAENLRESAEAERTTIENARRYIGAYDPATAYAVGNNVAHDGNSYRCIQACTGIAPTDASYWIMIAKKGNDGSGTGDMSISTYDPTGKSADAFSMANMAEGTTNKIFTATERTKLSGIADNANNYSHPTTAGNKHVPTGGASNQFLKYSASGTAVWSNLPSSASTVTYTGTLASASWTGSSAPYSQTITVTGMASTDEPIYDLTLSGTYATDVTLETEWANVFDLHTGTNQVTVKAHAIPTVDLPFRMKVVR